MRIQINTDNRVNGSDQLARTLEADLTRALGRFAAQITRVEVHLQDTNADKAGATDKRCLIEARLAGRDPIAVSNTGETIRVAYAGARTKLVTVLARRLARVRPPKGRDPFERIGVPA